MALQRLGAVAPLAARATHACGRCTQHRPHLEGCCWSWCCCLLLPVAARRCPRFVRKRASSAALGQILQLHLCLLLLLLRLPLRESGSGRSSNRSSNRSSRKAEVLLPLLLLLLLLLLPRRAAARAPCSGRASELLRALELARGAAQRGGHLSLHPERLEISRREACE